MKSESKKSIAESLEIEEGLLVYMPYLLQDLWALGSSVDQIIQVFYTIHSPEKNINVLDLACGKGAVSVMLASKYGYSITGIDAMPEFIVFVAPDAFHPVPYTTPSPSPHPVIC